MGSAALENKRIVIAGSRKTDEMSLIIEKQGGIPAVYSLQGITMHDEALLEEPLREFAEAGADWVILTTGIGAESLVNTADKLGIKDKVLDRLSSARIASRGYKTSAFLKRSGLAAVVSDDDGTMQGLSENLAPFSFEGQSVMIQLHGEPAPELEQFLLQKGASSVVSILPYRHVPPETGTIEAFLSELAEQRVDAVCFTTAVQVQYLFRHARATGREELLLEQFRQGTLAVAVGKVTAQALKEHGVDRIVMPELERMGAMIIELARYYEKGGNA